MTILPKSVAAYPDQGELVLGWCKNWLHQDEFDKRAHAADPFGFRFHRLTGDTIILPLHGGLQQELLAILTELYRAGMIEVRGEPGAVEYRTATPPETAA